MMHSHGGEYRVYTWNSKDTQSEPTISTDYYKLLINIWQRKMLTGINVKLEEIMETWNLVEEIVHPKKNLEEKKSDATTGSKGKKARYQQRYYGG